MSVGHLAGHLSIVAARYVNSCCCFNSYY